MTRKNSLTYEELNFDNHDLDVEYCEKLLLEPSSQNYASLNNYLKKCSNEWLEDFLECNALQLMFSTLHFMNMKKHLQETTHFTDAVIELEIIRSVKLILNNQVGINYLINGDEYLLYSMTLSEYYIN